MIVHKDFQLLLEVLNNSYLVKEAQVTERMNEHTQLEVKLLIKDYKESADFRCFDTATLKIVTKKEKILFNGIVLRAVRYREAGQYYEDVLIGSYTQLFDCQKKICSFQQESRTYGELIQLILSQYPGPHTYGTEMKKIIVLTRCFFNTRKAIGNF